MRQGLALNGLAPQNPDRREHPVGKYRNETNADGHETHVVDGDEFAADLVADLALLDIQVFRPMRPIRSSVGPSARNDSWNMPVTWLLRKTYMHRR